MGFLHIRFLGAFSIDDGDRSITSLSSSRLKSLLAYLVLHSDAPQDRQMLAFMFWPDSSEKQAHTNLRKIIYTMRKSLPQANSYLIIDRQNIQWQAEASYTLDILDFEKAVSQAKTASELRQAVALYRGNLLPNLYDDWILPERERLFQLFVNALERLILLLEEKRDYKTAIDYVQLLLQHDPLREETYRRLMQLYALNGDLPGVIQTYHNCAAALKRELEIEPSQLTQDVYNRMRTLYGPLSALPPASPDLMSRRLEWAKLQEVWMSVVAGQPQMVLLTGAEAAGKTRLAEELLQWAIRQGVATARTRCFETESDLPYAPLVNWLKSRQLPPLNRLWLTEIARLLPELLVSHPDLPPPDPLDAPWQRHRFFEALARALLASQPTLLYIDDLQYASHELLEWLHYFMHFQPDTRLLILGTLRIEELNPKRPLYAHLPELRQSGILTEIYLKPISEEETAQLDGIDSLKERLVGETLSDPDVVAIPMQVTAETHQSILPTFGRKLASLASRFERSIRLERLSHRGDGDNDDDGDKDGGGDNSSPDSNVKGLWQQLVMEELSHQTQLPSQIGVGAGKYSDTPQVQQTELHVQVAEALESTYRGDLDLVSGEIASHYEQAGKYDRAMPYYQRAVEFARNSHNYEAAAHFYEHLLPLSPKPEKAEIRLKLAEVLQASGKWREAEDNLRLALKAVNKANTPHLYARCEVALGELFTLEGSNTEARELLERARGHFDVLGDQKLLCTVLGSLGRVAFRRMEISKASQYFEEQFQIANQINEPHELGVAAGNLGELSLLRGDAEKADEYFQRELRMANEISDLSMLAVAIGHHGLFQSYRGDNSGAAASFEQQIQVAEKIGDRRGLCEAWGNLGTARWKQSNQWEACELFIKQFKLAEELNDRTNLNQAAFFLGNVFFELGEDDRAIDWISMSLSLALDLEAPGLAGRAATTLGQIFERKDDPDLAEEFFRYAADLLSDGPLPLLAGEFYNQYAQFLYHRSRVRQGLEANYKALWLAQMTGQEEQLFSAQAMSIRMRHALGELSTRLAITELEKLLGIWTRDEEQAVLHAEIYRLDGRHKSNAEIAAAFLRSLYNRFPRRDYREQYEEITLDNFSEPTFLPDLVELQPEAPPDLEELRERLEKITIVMEARPKEILSLAMLGLLIVKLHIAIFFIPIIFRML